MQLLFLEKLHKDNNDKKVLVIILDKIECFERQNWF